MRLTNKRRLELVAQGALVSVRGREYIALDVLDTPIELATPEPEPMPEAEAEPMPELSALKERRRERKADVEGSAGSS